MKGTCLLVFHGGWGWRGKLPKMWLQFQSKLKQNLGKGKECKGQIFDNRMIYQS